MATFKARARTVDLLGRQQIAGIPTAISELFKNAYDAYAHHVTVNYLPYDDLLVIADDGVGMSTDDFESRWLVLGTESKVTSPLPPPPGESRRATLGEKGIGRLAIAAIGPQLCVITRSISAKTVVSYLDWRLFEEPRLNLDDIPVAIHTLSDSGLPEEKDIASLLDDFVQTLRERNLSETGDVTESAERFRLDPYELLRSLGIAHWSSGTTFIVKGVPPMLKADIDDFRDRNAESKLVNTLVGFSNTMTPGHAKPAISTAFYYHETPTSYSDIIAESEFFTPEDFEVADHHISGEFDEFGTFRGTITLYNTRHLDVTVPYDDAKASTRRCGPFRVDIAVVQGDRQSSRIDPQRYVELDQKLRLYGGLYIYRDGIRILPYGNADYDFLDVEKNRTKNLGYYYFSYRRMFGAISLTSRANAALQEKAGREGFQENIAYRQFRAILKGFLLQLAVRYFNRRDEDSAFAELRSDIERRNRARASADRERERADRSISRQIHSHVRDIESGRVEKDVGKVIESIDAQLSNAAASKDTAIENLARVEAELLKRIDLVESKLEIDEPVGVALSPEVRAEFEHYRYQLDLVRKTTFARARNDIVRAVSKIARATGQGVSVRRRLAAAFASNRDTELSRIENLEGEALRLCNEVADKIHASHAAFIAHLEEIRTNFRSVDLKQRPVTQLFADMAHEVRESSVEYRRQLESVTVGLRRAWLNGESSITEIQAALQEEVLELRRQISDDLDIAQLGMAVQALDHEFAHVTRELRSSLRELRSWAKKNRAIVPVSERIRTNFEHLDSYLKLFTPLQRRLYRSEVEFSGREIAQFLRRLFSERFESDGVDFEVSKAFIALRIRGMRATYYPAFVNLIDNALFWLRHVRDRRLALDSEGGAIYVSNSGPPIPPEDRSRIFEYGFSRKPGGRGLGLYITREVLRRDGLDLKVIPPISNYGVTFEIVIGTEPT